MPRMGDKRSAKKVLLVRKGAETTRKIEIFQGGLFYGRTFILSSGESAPKDRSDLYRLRVNGKWFPARQKLLLNKDELNTLIIKLVGE